MGYLRVALSVLCSTRPVLILRRQIGEVARFHITGWSVDVGDRGSLRDRRNFQFRYEMIGISIGGRNDRTGGRIADHRVSSLPKVRHYGPRRDKLRQPQRTLRGTRCENPDASRATRAPLESQAVASPGQLLRSLAQP